MSNTAPIGTTIHHRSNLREQTHDSKVRNIQAEIIRQLDMQFTPSIQADGSERLADLGLLGTQSGKFALLLAKHFPFLLSPMDLIEKSETLHDLVLHIADKVGA